MAKSFSEAKKIIADTWEGSPSVAICHAVIDHLEANRPEKVEISEVVRLAGREQFDEDVSRALVILVGSSCSVLDTTFRFKDDDGSFLPVDGKDFEAARKTGIFPHPVTREPVADHETRIYPYMVPRAGLYQDHALEKDQTMQRLTVTGDARPADLPDYPYAAKAPYSEIWVSITEGGKDGYGEPGFYGTLGEYIDTHIETSDIGADEIAAMVADVQASGEHILPGFTGVGFKVARIPAPEEAVEASGPSL